MSLELIEQEICRFLSTTAPEVLSFSGRWGVGKTFAWKKLLKDAQQDRSIALKHYSYVSLFGVNSLQELKYSIFENTVGSSDVGIEPSLETLKSNTGSVVKRLGKYSLSFIQQLPKVKSYVSGLGPLWFLSVSETMICLDDIERHGLNLAVRDILGLVSLLKEQKGCKVVLILNDEAFDERSDKEDYKVYLEKVVDIILKFTPSPAESVRIALSGTSPAIKLLRESSVALGLSNIRLIKKIERTVRLAESMLKNLDQIVITQAVKTLTLAAWSIYEPNGAPSITYLRNRAARMLGAPKGEVPEKEAAWNAILDAYGFLSFDEFDEVLLEGMQKGFFDPSRLQQYAAVIDRNAKNSQSRGAVENAWRTFHDSFTDNEDKVVETIYQASISNLPAMSVLDLNGTMWLFKALDQVEMAQDIVDRFVALRQDDPKVFDLDNHPFRANISEPDLINQFRRHYASSRSKNERSPETVLLEIATVRGWSPEDLSTLAKLDADDYYALFKSHCGEELHQMIKVCLGFSMGGASDQMNEISRKAKEALGRIGDESRINALRVRKYGVHRGAGPNVGGHSE